MVIRGLVISLFMSVLVGCSEPSPYTDPNTGELMMVNAIDDLTVDESFALKTMVADWDRLDEYQRNYIMALICNHGPKTKELWLEMIIGKFELSIPPIPTVPKSASEEMRNERIKEYKEDVLVWLDSIHSYLRSINCPERLIGEVITKLDPLPVEELTKPDVLMRCDPMKIELPQISPDRIPVIARRAP
jgi:hypothetical protein